MATGKAVNQIMEEEEAEGEAVELHGVINPQEASRHVMSLDEALKKKLSLALFSSIMAIVASILLIALMLSIKKAAINCS